MSSGIATVTSKLQFTVPVAVIRSTGLKRGDKVVFTERKGTLIVTPQRRIVEELAGSVPPRTGEQSPRKGAR